MFELLFSQKTILQQRVRRLLRSHTPEMSITLMVTVEDSKEKVVEALKIGIRDYIVKPVSKNSFESKVKTLLKF